MPDLLEIRPSRYLKACFSYNLKKKIFQLYGKTRSRSLPKDETYRLARYLSSTHEL